MAHRQQSPMIREGKIPILFFDGGARGNPGRGAGAAAIVMPDGKQYIVSEYLEFATCNEAEYTGLIVGLEKAISLGIRELKVFGDSNLVVNQVNGTWKVKSDRLKSLYDQAIQLLSKFKQTTLDWIPRHENQLADSAVNQCIDDGGKQTEDPPKTICPYSIGDVVAISNLGNPEEFLEGTIIASPEVGENDSWILKIEIDQD